MNFRKPLDHRFWHPLSTAHFGSTGEVGRGTQSHPGGRSHVGTKRLSDHGLFFAISLGPEEALLLNFLLFRVSLILWRKPRPKLRRPKLLRWISCPLRLHLRLLPLRTLCPLMLVPCGAYSGVLLLLLLRKNPSNPRPRRNLSISDSFCEERREQKRKVTAKTKTKNSLFLL